MSAEIKVKLIDPRHITVVEETIQKLYGDKQVSRQVDPQTNTSRYFILSEEGKYEPREITYKDIAEELGNPQQYRDGFPGPRTFEYLATTNNGDSPKEVTVVYTSPALQSSQD